MYCSCTFYENNGSCDHLYRFLQKIDVNLINNLILNYTTQIYKKKKEEEIIEDYEYSHNHN